MSRAALLGALLLAAAVGRAEPLYVVEQLVVSLNGSPDGSGERVGTLKSGDRVELLERSGEAAHVRTPEGREGWLKAAYLSAEAPLRPRLAQSEAELARVRAELAQLRAERARPAP
ncbi:MAG: TIGR04211 family SH3 domain-containing protein, partial [Gammaproteobacteria bacterium]|nr:TIGR04211 family SH3 domain-containing protein [Gammaproteobacteria bacterium]